MLVCRIGRWGAGAGVAGGAAVAAALLGMGAAHADDSTEEINGWTVTLTGGDGTDSLLPAATLSDPSDSLGLGTEPINGSFGNVAATPLSDIGSNESFNTALSTIGTADNLNIQDNWFSGFEISSVQAGQDNAVMAFLVPDAGGNQLVDLFNYGSPDAPPLVNPDATGPIDIGGVQLADPQDGALFNDLFGAAFQGDSADWTNAMTLFDDWLGIDPSVAADASALLPDFAL